MPELGKQPAPFTQSIIRQLWQDIPRYVPQGHIIHDPFAGDGTRLGALCDLLGYPFSAVDLERWRDADQRVRFGNSIRPETYPQRPFAVVTSPTYNNGINDHFKPQDASRRKTYRVAAGHPLHEQNTGRWSGRHSKQGEQMYWQITREVVKNWPAVAMVNVKNSIRHGAVYPLVEMWTELLKDPYDVIEQREVPCPGWRVGTNHAARIDTEAILIARRA